MRRTQRKIIVIISALVLLSLAVWGGLFVSKQRATADRQRCASQLIAIGYAITLYCNENRWELPPSLSDVMATQDIWPGVFVCPASGDTPASGDLERRARQLTMSSHCSSVRWQRKLA